MNYVDPNGEFFIIDDLLVGFFSGLFSGKSLSASIDQGVEYASNSVDLWSSFGRGDFGQILSKFTWELPQQVIGVLGGHVTNMIGQVNSITHSEGATLIETKADYWGGFTMGSIITADKNTTIKSELFYHEYGHYMQSQLIGPYYIPFAALPSLGSAIINPWAHDKKFYTETWANKLAKKKFGR